MPDPQTDLQGILNQDFNDWTIKVCLASEKKAELTHEFQVLQITEALTEDFRRLIKTNLAKASERHLSAYSPGSRMNSQEIEHVDLAVPDFQAVNDQLEPLTALENLTDFSAGTSFTKNLRFYVIVAERPEHEPIYFFRQYTQAKELSRSSIFGAIMQRGQFDATREPLFLFDGTLDCFKQGGRMFFLSKTRFEQIFRLYETMNEKASSTLDRLEQRAVIANFGAFRDDCGKSHFARRDLADLMNEAHIQELTMDRVERQLIRTPEIPIEIENGQIMYKPEHIWQLIKFLRGYYYKSEITLQTHEATGNRSIETGS